MNYELRIKKQKNKACPAKLKRSKGYTIIETMIAISIFLVVVMIGIGSLLNSTLIYGKSQDSRSILDNLSFIMEDMSRNIRMGYNFHCIDNGNLTDTSLYSCANGGSGISFKNSYGNQWVYIISNETIQKSTSGGTSGTFVELTTSEIKIDPSSSGFTVTGAELPPGDINQPFVTIKLVGTITSKDNIVTPFSLQTSVSQRLADIEI